VLAIGQIHDIAGPLNPQTDRRNSAVTTNTRGRGLCVRRSRQQVRSRL